jgi:hypothetical protein
MSMAIEERRIGTPSANEIKNKSELKISDS